MNAFILPRAESAHLIDQAIARHGALRVLARALAALLRSRFSPRPRPPDADELDPRLRRDLGLPEIDRHRDAWRRLL